MYGWPGHKEKIYLFKKSIKKSRMFFFKDLVICRWFTEITLIFLRNPSHILFPNGIFNFRSLCPLRCMSPSSCILQDIPTQTENWDFVQKDNWFFGWYRLWQYRLSCGISSSEIKHLTWIKCKSQIWPLGGYRSFAGWQIFEMALIQKEWQFLRMNLHAKGQ